MSRCKNCDDDINKKISTGRGIILMKGIDDMKPITHKNCLGVRGIKVDKTLMWISIILIALSGFSIKINSFKFEWLGVLETIIRIFK